MNTKAKTLQPVHTHTHTQGLILEVI